MDAPGWPARRLAGFTAAVSAAGSETEAARAVVEHAAEALDADVAAIVCDGGLVAAVGYPEGRAAVAELATLKPGPGDTCPRLELPGAGACAAAAAALDHPAGATLVVARQGPDGLTSEEHGLLQGMARIAAMTMGMLHVLDDERAAHEELQGLAREQAALRRVVTLVAQAARPEEIFSAVAEEVARLSEADIATVLRYEPGGSATVVGSWGDPGTHFPIGSRLAVAGEGVAVSVLRTGQPARTLRFAGPPGSVADALRRAGVQAGSGSPITVEGQLWGVVIAARARPEPLPPAAERRIPAFTELAATAIANAQARAELRRVADEQAALRRVATLVARGVEPDLLFAAVAEEVGQVLPVADLVLVGRYDSGEAIEFVGGWSRAGEAAWVGQRVGLGGHNVATLVFESGQPARVARLRDNDADVTTLARQAGARCSAGAPIGVAGRLWGVMTAASVREDGLPAGIEDRLTGFTELIATAIANAQARLDLRGYVDEQTALRRVAMLVARAASTHDVFAAVTAEAGRLLGADIAHMVRYGTGGRTTVVAAWPAVSPPERFSAGQLELGKQSLSALVLKTGRPARIDYDDVVGPAADLARERGIRSCVGAPISVARRVWGLMAVMSKQEPLPQGTEVRLNGFTGLVATAIASTQAREELRGLAEEQAALRRVATLVARGVPPTAVFAAVAEEVRQVVPATEMTTVLRFDTGRSYEIVGGWSKKAGAVPVGAKISLAGRSVAQLVLDAGRPMRLNSYLHVPGPIAAAARGHGATSAVGVPVSVGGHLWGAVLVASTASQPLPEGTEERLAGFAELVATAIANAEAHALLTASRARIVATADQTRRRIENDLHDAQQRLVSLTLRLRAARAVVPGELAQVRDGLARAADDLTAVLDELREYARGIHPAILAERGLTAALTALARRSPVPVQLDVRATTRLPEPVEVTAYYVTSEALANAAKHANASAVHVCLDVVDEVVRLSVSDNGTGGAVASRGSGLLGLKDRVEAIGGTFTVHSRPGEGTRLVAEFRMLPGH